MRNIPIYNREGIIAYTKVDDEDYFRLIQYRWNLNSKGYVTSTAPHPNGQCFKGLDGRVRNKRITLFMQRVVLGYAHENTILVDHKNRDKLDNQKINLRPANASLNAQNSLRQTGKYSTYRGVTFNKNKSKWIAHAELNGQRFHLGYFLTEEEAAQKASTWRAINMPYSPDKESILQFINLLGKAVN